MAFKLGLSQSCTRSWILRFYKSWVTLYLGKWLPQSLFILSKVKTFWKPQKVKWRPFLPATFLAIRTYITVKLTRLPTGNCGFCPWKWVACSWNIQIQFLKKSLPKAVGPLGRGQVYTEAQQLFAPLQQLVAEMGLEPSSYCMRSPVVFWSQVEHFLWIYHGNICNVIHWIQSFVTELSIRCLIMLSN